jgi:hypothetical protein
MQDAEDSKALTDHTTIFDDVIGVRLDISKLPLLWNVSGNLIEATPDADQAILSNIGAPLPIHNVLPCVDRKPSV